MWVFLGMWVIGMILYPTWLLGGEKSLTILHTNDLHSHLLGFSPNIDYSPLKTDDDATVGGWSRIAAAIKSEKAKRTNPTLVLDAGDFLMGSLFHMVAREEGLELRVLKEMGYDVITLGNHEFIPICKEDEKKDRDSLFVKVKIQTLQTTSSIILSSS